MNYTDFKVITSHRFTSVDDDEARCDLCGFKRALHHKDENGRVMPLIIIRRIKDTKAYGATCRICPHGTHLGSWRMMMLFAQNHSQRHL